ncbi:hypothetical protein MMC29_006777 [Sticta canariensis]|nr:hypothetical protein [Sticta canariensis]
MASQSSLVLFRGQQCTGEEISQRLQRYESVAERYEAQVEIRNCMMKNHERMEREIENFYHHVVKDQAWIYVGGMEFEEESASQAIIQGLNSDINRILIIERFRAVKADCSGVQTVCPAHIQSLAVHCGLAVDWLANRRVFLVFLASPKIYQILRTCVVA